MSGVFEHPLGLPEQRANPYRIPTGPETGVDVVAAGVNPVLQFPERRGEHNWLVMTKTPVRAEYLLKGMFAFSPGALAEIGCYCWVCERNFDPDIAEGPCLGDPRGLFIPTRAEFLAWSVEEAQAWLDRWRESRERG